MNKILSIIIPTRNRQQYCVESVLSMLQELDETCEIVIQDNSSVDSLKNALENLNSNLIIYNYNPNQLSFINNFEEAVLLSSGKYFCILGDDDSITEDMLSIVQWMDKNDIDSLASSHVIDYIWPNKTIENYKEGFLRLPAYKGQKEYVNAKEKLVELLQNGFISYQSFQLPRTYHGIVKRSCMDKVKRLSGKYFGGLTPDMYSTVALACVVEKHCILDYPFSVAGACPESATVKATVGGHSGKLSDAPHLANRGDYSWEKTIPKYYSVETIWAETAIKAIKDIGLEELLRYFDNYRLYIIAIYVNRKYIFNLAVSETLKLSNNLQISKQAHIFKIAKECFKALGMKFRKKLFLKKSSLPDEITFNNVTSLTKAKKLISKNLIQLDL
jgi:glycosyltransferase involved in cell wall biosynthesis